MPKPVFRHSSPRCITLAILSAAAALTLASTSAADPRQTETSTGPDGYTYTFGDDPLRAGGLDPKDTRLHVVRHAVRSLLIRPRVQFIQEMLKSVENL